MRWKLITTILIGLTILGIIGYLVWPFTYTLALSHTGGEAEEAHVTILKGGEIVYQNYTSLVNVSLWKGEYEVIVDARGYDKQSLALTNTLRFGAPFEINEQSILSPKYFSVSDWTFKDPLLTTTLRPRGLVRGISITDQEINDTYSSTDKIPFGNYTIDLAYWDMTRTIHITDAQIVEPEEDRYLSLPSGTINLTEEEVNWTLNFLRDYMTFSKRKLLTSEDRGLPQQFYLPSKDLVLSTGDLVYLSCQAQSQQGNHPLFVEPEKYWNQSSGSPKVTECYWKARSENFIPSYISSIPTPNFLYLTTSKNYSADELYTRMWTMNKEAPQTSFDYRLHDINTKKRSLEVAFTFDIESGRYVPFSGGLSISPCKDENYSIGLPADLSEKDLCQNPALVGWMTPRHKDVSEKYKEYPYPAVSGILGYREILGYSERYGLPTTNYYVQKDINVFESLEPELIERTRKLISKGLIEVGSHTRYHSGLGFLEPFEARREMSESKKWLENYFGVPVVGYRTPYLLPTAKDYTIHAKILGEIGYTYYSEEGPVYGRVPGYAVVHKPWNTFGYTAEQTPAKTKSLMESRNYLITLDHPWNMVYKDGALLKEYPEGLVTYRANILTIISNGGIPVLAKDLELPVR
jgi:peptidoglycan/xylan/chitin deacetylase (PgdA/CDA1 family)